MSSEPPMRDFALVSEAIIFSLFRDFVAAGHMLFIKCIPLNTLLLAALLKHDKLIEASILPGPYSV